MEKTIKNKLGGRLSPYLREHAKNPLAWQEWNEKAFQLARDLDRPIFFYRLRHLSLVSCDGDRELYG
ncbi:MAG TPA: DUF255 domain-containing protein [Candidatus Marinimicrobia bacterium]|nr:DUF255 domain-containing protein [Candidatus Neomarinimicrobiota bacterium]